MQAHFKAKVLGALFIDTLSKLDDEKLLGPEPGVHVADIPYTQPQLDNAG